MNGPAVQFREATSADVPAMAACRSTELSAGAADARMTAYFDGRHHPQHALLPRIGYVALVDATVIGYIAGHRTTRYGCAGEVQYLFVAPDYRRRGIAAALLRRLAGWFRAQRATKICVNVDADSPAARPFHSSQGASALNQYWAVWEDVAILLERPAIEETIR